jgi:hypothetical protein
MIDYPELVLLAFSTTGAWFMTDVSANGSANGHPGLTNDTALDLRREHEALNVRLTANNGSWIWKINM